MKLLTDSTFGVVEFNILGDTKVVLQAGIQLALQHHSKFTHYRVITKKGGDANELHLCWTDHNCTTELPFTLTTVESISSFIASWIAEKGKYDEETYCDGDGSNTKGVRLTNDYPDEYDQRTPYLALRVIPEYVYYGK